MTKFGSLLAKGAALGLVLGASVCAASAAGAAETSYVVCNRWNECWRVHEHYSNYPSDAAVVYHDQAWWDAHEHDTDTHWTLLPDPSNDKGWYDEHGHWHPFDHD